MNVIIEREKILSKLPKVYIDTLEIRNHRLVYSLVNPFKVLRPIFDNENDNYSVGSDDIKYKPVLWIGFELFPANPLEDILNRNPIKVVYLYEDEYGQEFKSEILFNQCGV